MGINIYGNGSCAAFVWERGAEGIQLVLQQSIGIIDLTDASKESFDVDGGISFGIASLPRASRAGWIRYEVHTGGVTPTHASPQSYTRDWYQAPLARPLYTVPAGNIRLRMNNPPGGVAGMGDLVIDAGRIFYSAFITV